MTSRRIAPKSTDLVSKRRRFLAEDSALELFILLSRARNAVTRHAENDAARHGLTLAEFVIVEALYDGGPLLLGELQRKVLVSSGGVTYLVDRLEEKKLVERRECPGDRRARYAALTPAGEAFVGRVLPSMRGALRERWRD